MKPWDCARCLLNADDGLIEDYRIAPAVTLVGGVALCRSHGVSAMRNRNRAIRPDTRPADPR